MRNFKSKDFKGGGRYIIRTIEPENSITKYNFLSTIVYKIGYDMNTLKIGNGKQLITKTSVSDGWTTQLNFLNDFNEETNLRNKRLWQTDEISEGIDKFVSYLNDASLSQEHRFATKKEILKAVKHSIKKFK